MEYCHDRAHYVIALDIVKVRCGPGNVTFMESACMEKYQYTIVTLLGYEMERYYHLN